MRIKAEQREEQRKKKLLHKLHNKGVIKQIATRKTKKEKYFD